MSVGIESPRLPHPSFHRFALGCDLNCLLDGETFCAVRLICLGCEILLSLVASRTYSLVMTKAIV